MTKPQEELLRRHNRVVSPGYGAESDDDESKMYDPLLPSIGNPSKNSIWPSIRLSLVVLSIGAGSLFLVALDSLVDNLLPSAHSYLMNIYKTTHDADWAWEWIVASRIYGLALGCFLSVFLGMSFLHIIYCSIFYYSGPTIKKTTTNNCISFKLFWRSYVWTYCACWARSLCSLCRSIH